PSRSFHIVGWKSAGSSLAVWGKKVLEKKIESVAESWISSESGISEVVGSSGMVKVGGLGSSNNFALSLKHFYRAVFCAVDVVCRRLWCRERAKASTPKHFKP